MFQKYNFKNFLLCLFFIQTLQSNKNSNDFFYHDPTGFSKEKIAQKKRLERAIFATKIIAGLTGFTIGMLTKKGIEKAVYQNLIISAHPDFSKNYLQPICAQAITCLVVKQSTNFLKQIGTISTEHYMKHKFKNYPEFLEKVSTEVKITKPFLFNSVNATILALNRSFSIYLLEKILLLTNNQETAAIAKKYVPNCFLFFDGMSEALTRDS